VVPSAPHPVAANVPPPAPPLAGPIRLSVTGLTEIDIVRYAAELAGFDVTMDKFAVVLTPSRGPK
jgi:hypothetical protein